MPYLSPTRHGAWEDGRVRTTGSGTDSSPATTPADARRPGDGRADDGRADDGRADDEFREVPALARALGVTDPLRPSRLAVPTADGGTLSVIRWRRPVPDATTPADTTPATTGDVVTADSVAHDAPAGTAPDAAVVLLHGVGIEAHSFDATALALGVSALAVDLPGHGRSSWRDDAVYSADTVAPTVLDALDALAVPPGVLVGHSLGAIVAARAAARRPDRVRGLVLVDMSPDFTQRAVDRIVRALEAEPDFADVDDVVERALALRLGEDRAALVRDAEHTTVVGPAGRRVRRHHFPHLPDGVAADVGRFVEGWRDLEALDVPLLLVRGDRGYVSARLAAGFAERLPDAEVVTVPARHTVQTQAPVALARAIADWRRAHDL